MSKLYILLEFGCNEAQISVRRFAELEDNEQTEVDRSARIIVGRRDNTIAETRRKVRSKVLQYKQ